MKKFFLIAVMAIFCVQGIWAQMEEMDSVPTPQEIKNEAAQVNNEVMEEIMAIKEGLRELQESSKTPYNPNKLVYKPFWNGKKTKWNQGQSIVFGATASFAKDLNGLLGNDIGLTDKAADQFDDNAEDAKPDAGFALNAGYVRSFTPGQMTDKGWLCNRFGRSYNLGMLFDYKKHNELSAYSLYALAGIEYGRFHKYGIGLNLLLGFGSSLGYLFDLDDLDEDPVPDPKICFKGGAELWLRLGNSEAGLIPGVETRLFVRIIYAFDKDTYDPELNTYRCSPEMSSNAGISFFIPF